MLNLDYSKINKKATPDFTCFAIFNQNCPYEPYEAKVKRGQASFIDLIIWSKIIKFSFEKTSDFKSFFSCELPLPNTIMDHDRFYFYPSNPCS